MKRNVKIDKQKAKALYQISKITFERLNSFNKLKYPSNTLDDYYNILHQLIEAESCIKGIKFSGDYAHKELIDWGYTEGLFSEQEKLFLQNLRNFRNKISYEGFLVKPFFITQNEEKIMTIIKRLNKIIEELL